MQRKNGERRSADGLRKSTPKLFRSFRGMMPGDVCVRASGSDS
jgi:hypothetical protein